MNKIVIYLVGVLLAIAFWYGPAQAVIYTVVTSRADRTAYQKFEKDPKGWAAPKEQIDEHYKASDDLARLISVIGAVVFGFAAGVVTCAVVGRLERSGSRVTD